MKSTLFYEDGKTEVSRIAQSSVPFVHPTTGVTVDPSCNTTITITCLKQLYNAVGYKVKAAKKNSIAITSYLEQFANFADLQTFYKDQLPEAVNSSFKLISVAGMSSFAYPFCD